MDDNKHAMSNFKKG